MDLTHTKIFLRYPPWAFARYVILSVLPLFGSSTPFTMMVDLCSLDIGIARVERPSGMLLQVASVMAVTRNLGHGQRHHVK
jgi:hypothetical protein